MGSILHNARARGDIDAYKLERMENPCWDPPNLSFTIERHGGMARGSTRAEIQHWNVDIERREVECQEIGYRQVIDRQAPVDVKPIADELSKLIMSSSSDERLKWSADGRVQVLSGKIFPADKASKQTVVGRRKRLLKALEELLAPHSWQRRGSWWEHAKSKDGIC